MPATTTPSSGHAGLPTVQPWSPDRADVDPEIKARAARVVETLGGWDQPGQGGVEAAARRLSALGEDGRLASEARALFAPQCPAAVVEILEAQYGGLLADRASVLVVCRQWRAFADGSVAAGGTTVDVRLEHGRPHWHVTAFHPARPGPPRRPLSGPARAVLASKRIELPPAGRADVLSGRVHDSVLVAMLRLARTYRIGVSVVRSGHPIRVFGTDRLSDHPQGRAFDTFRIDGRLVVDPATPRSLVTGYMTAAARVGSYNVGGPYLLAGPGNQFFSNATHHDHVHAGFAT